MNEANCIVGKNEEYKFVPEVSFNFKIGWINKKKITEKRMGIKSSTYFVFNHDGCKEIIKNTGGTGFKQ